MNCWLQGPAVTLHSSCGCILTRVSFLGRLVSRAFPSNGSHHVLAHSPTLSPLQLGHIFCEYITCSQGWYQIIKFSCKWRDQMYWGRFSTVTIRHIKAYYFLFMEVSVLPKFQQISYCNQNIFASKNLNLWIDCNMSAMHTRVCGWPQAVKGILKSCNKIAAVDRDFCKSEDGHDMLPLFIPGNKRLTFISFSSITVHPTLFFLFCS